MHSSIDVWSYREGLRVGAAPRDVVGYGVEARDGSIGKVDDATFDVGSSYLVVDTGPWIFGKKVMLPAGLIREVDHNEEKIFVDRTKEQIKNAPEFEDSLTRDDDYRGRLGSYYGPGGSGYVEDESLVEKLRGRTREVGDAPERADDDTMKTNPVTGQRRTP
jgi:hypothetical protein